MIQHSKVRYYYKVCGSRHGAGEAGLATGDIEFAPLPPVKQMSLARVWGVKRLVLARSDDCAELALTYARRI